MKDRLRWPRAVLIGLLALIGVGASASFYFREPYNPGFAAFAIPTALHVVLGGIYLALAPFQFVRAIRDRWLGYHRWTGRVLVGMGVVVGLTALFMSLVIPTSGWSERVILSPFAVLFGVALVNGFRHVRAGRIAHHREWMIRAFAVGLAIATMRVLFIPTLIVLGDPTEAQIALSSIASFTAAFVLHVVVAELWIRGSRQRGVSGVMAGAGERGEPGR